MRHHGWGSLVVVVASASALAAPQAGSLAGPAKQEAEKVVTVFRDEDCGGPAIARIKEVASQLGLRIKIEEVIVATYEQAVEHRYFGSPTVRIKGLDIDPKVRARTSYALG